MGGYLGVSGASARAKWLEPYFALNGFSDNPWFGRQDDGSLLIQGGANVRLGPATWRVRPVARVGVGSFAHDEITAFTGVTGGVGLYVRGSSRFWGLLSTGAALTADFWSREGTNFAVAHAGFYFRIG